MRTESEMLDQILSFARSDDRIRVVTLNGSRVNPNVPADIFQDYDVVYFVEELSPYIHNQSIIDYFGETMIVQLPEEMRESANKVYSRYAYLMQFRDGNRIDLTFRLLDDLDRAIREDTLTKVLLDKDHRVGALPVPSDQGYIPSPPTREQFDDCCNEFWWLMPYIAKGLWRGEIISPWYYQDLVFHRELTQMITWYYGIQTNFEKSPGKHGRFLKEHLGDDFWGMIKGLLSEKYPGKMWDSLYTMGELFRQVAMDVADHFEYSYPHQDDARVTEFMRLIQSLSRDASSFDP